MEIDINDLMEEMGESQSFQNFRIQTEKALEDQQKFDQLKLQEKDLNEEIKKINLELKKKQDEFAKEAKESSDEIMNQKRRWNEQKTERELITELKKREIDGKLACKKRIQSKEEMSLRDKIAQLNKGLEVEQIVSKKIQDFIVKKKKKTDGINDEREKKKEDKLKELQNQKEDIDTKMGFAQQEEQEYQKRCDLENEEREKQTMDDASNLEKEQSKVQEKLDMESAARYVQKKWIWYQTEGKLLAKKKKKGKGKKKKKKA